ncbi:MAG: iron permease [Clostridiaceae bacterium]|nr:iron permease [Clostridiaceae bacterium]
MKKVFALFLLVMITISILPSTVFAASAEEDLNKANQAVLKSIESVQSGDMEKVKESYNNFQESWRNIEDGVKAKSKEAYGSIEDKMGMVTFLLSQNPIQKDKLLQALKDLDTVDKDFASGKFKSNENSKSSSKDNGQGNTTVEDLVKLLEKAKSQIDNGDTSAALKTMNNFSSSWLDVEGVVLTKSKKVYDDAEKDMVSAKAYLSTSPVQTDNALKAINKMHTYLSPLAGGNSYSVVDVITIILREGLEALLVVIALLGYLNRSGHEDKKIWIYGGVGIGFAVSIVLAVIVKVLFSSGTFGNNNFLISGWTGAFAAVMLIYVSYWLHSKSSVKAWQSYVNDKSSQAIATGSLFSLGLLAFLAVFREGTETVLFYIGMASSIKLSDLLIGIAIGMAILVFIALLILKVGLRIPMRPFFMVSSLLVFYLGLKFTGMGINGLQLAGLLPATSSDILPSIGWIGMYPTWEGFLPQLILIIVAITMLFINQINSKDLKVD